LDDSVKIKIEHEISRIEKSLVDVKPLLNLCKIKDPDIIEMTAAAQVLHSFYNGVESIIVLFFKYLNEKLPNFGQTGKQERNYIETYIYIRH
jgi:hypothetical protein